jgi:hypothetical protein
MLLSILKHPIILYHFTFKITIRKRFKICWKNWVLIGCRNVYPFSLFLQILVNRRKNYLRICCLILIYVLVSISALNLSLIAASKYKIEMKAYKVFEGRFDVQDKICNTDFNDKTFMLPNWKNGRTWLEFFQIYCMGSVLLTFKLNFHFKRRVEVFDYTMKVWILLLLLYLCIKKNYVSYSYPVSVKI